MENPTNLTLSWGSAVGVLYTVPINGIFTLKCKYYGIKRGYLGLCENIHILVLYPLIFSPVISNIMGLNYGYKIMR